MTTDGIVCSGGVAGGSACMSGGCVRGHQQLTWEKLSPEEFQQLQDFAACKSTLIMISLLHVSAIISKFLTLRC